ncbi:MAG: hypothetical protein Q9166_002185 [cf. Caloplaca sp. 2 TL-2023]
MSSIPTTTHSSNDTSSSLFSPSSDYEILLSLLHPSQPTVLEIEILPSSQPPHILSAPPALGIPKKILLQCFLHARKVFLSHTTNIPLSNGLASAWIEAASATKVLTLWEPNWNSAWAFRRRNLIGLRESDEVSEASEWGKTRLRQFVEADLAWVETLVTSPLDGKHAKSSWVWAHRLWIVKTFWREVVVENGGSLAALLMKEMEIVMVAGERHARNYYAWEYARQMTRTCMGSLTREMEEFRKLEDEPLDRRVWEQCTRMIHQWCLMHPRDISGWSFLVFLMDRRSLFGGLELGEASNAMKNTIRDIFQKTFDFVEKYNWKGESIEWFLKSAGHFQLDSND